MREMTFDLRSTFRASLRVVSGLIATGVVIAVASGAVMAQNKMPPTYAELAAEGERLAQLLCSSCHAMSGNAAGTATAGVPTFGGIAAKPGQSAEHLRHMFINPHPPMPDVQLSNPEIERLMTYIDSLRPAGAAPLVPRTSRGAKPVYPDPS
jgi:mono/diheme cytochrome c family protein